MVAGGDDMRLGGHGDLGKNQVIFWNLGFGCDFGGI